MSLLFPQKPFLKGYFPQKTVPKNALFIFLHVSRETHFAFFCESRFAFSFFSFSLKIHNILFLFFFLSAFLLHRKAAEFGISLRTFFRNPSRFAFSFFSFSLKIHNILFLFFFLSAFLLHRKAAEFGISLRTFFRNPLFQAFFQQKNPAQGFPAQGFLILFLFIFLIFILGYSRSF